MKYQSLFPGKNKNISVCCLLNWPRVVKVKVTGYISSGGNSALNVFASLLKKGYF